MTHPQTRHAPPRRELIVACSDRLRLTSEIDHTRGLAFLPAPGQSIDEKSKVLPAARRTNQSEIRAPSQTIHRPSFARK